MKVLLKEDVDKLGYAGDVHKVSAGFARNYLIPRNLAERATPSALKQAEVWRTKAEARRAQLKAEYDALSQQVVGVTLDFVAKAGDTGKLYGSITTANLAESLGEQLGIEVDRRKIQSEPIRQLGEHDVVLRLDADHEPAFKVIVKDEDGRMGPIETLLEETPNTDEEESPSFAQDEAAYRAEEAESLADTLDAFADALNG